MQFFVRPMRSTTFSKSAQPQAPIAMSDVTLDAKMIERGGSKTFLFCNF